METNEINAVEAVYNNQLNREPSADRPENTEQVESNSQKEAYKVELSEAAREQREFIEAERETARIENEQSGTYNASAKIGG